MSVPREPPSDDLIGGRFQHALKQQIGMKRPHSVATAATEADIKQRTLQGYVDGESLPSFANALRLMAILPPEFTEALLELVGLGGVRLLSGDAPNGRHMLHDLAKNVEQLAGALTRGELDHTTRPKIIAGCRKLACELEAFAAGLEVGASADGRP